MTKTFFTLEPCTSAKAYEIKFVNPIDLKKAEETLSKHYEILASTAVMVMVNIDNNAVTIYASGRAMIKYVDKDQANRIAKKIVDIL